MATILTQPNAASQPQFSLIGPGGALPLDRATVESLATFFVGLLDLVEPDPDLEPNGDELDGTPAEDDFWPHSDWRDAAGCPVSDPGGYEHDGREPDHDAEDDWNTWAHWMDHPAELHIGNRPGHTDDKAAR